MPEDPLETVEPVSCKREPIPLVLAPDLLLELRPSTLDAHRNHPGNLQTHWISGLHAPKF